MAKSLYKTVCAHCLHEMEVLTGCKCARVVPVPGERMSESTKAPAIDEVMARGFKSTITELTAALTAEIRDRVALTATVAALTAENERLESALKNIKGAARALLNPDEWRDGDVQVYPAAKAHAILAIIATHEVAALPSSRETTDGR